MSTRAHNQPVRITKTTLDRCAPPSAGQRFIRDRELKGFAVRITAQGARAFIVEKRINGRVRRITLGRYGELTVEQARRRAQQTLGQVAFGIDPIAERRKAQNQRVTLREAYRAFCQARKSLKASTLRDYDRIMDVVLREWNTTPLTGITRSLVARKHQQLGESSGEAYANLTMRFLRSLLNFAKATYDDGSGHSLLIENPVAVLSQTRAWYRSERRQTLIKASQLPAWYRGVQSLQEAQQPDSARMVADYLLLLLFTGLRSREAATLAWPQVDFAARTLTIRNTKNRQPFSLPLSTFLVDLLQARHAETAGLYVFPGRDAGCFVEPKRQVRHVIETSGVAFTLHDLRRTFITIAESLDVPPYAIKMLVNHKISHDVTGGYIVASVERLRAPMQRITDYLLRAIGADDTPNVIAMAEKVTAS